MAFAPSRLGNRQQVNWSTVNLDQRSRLTMIAARMCPLFFDFPHIEVISE
jgi:hypothetical protein